MILLGYKTNTKVLLFFGFVFIFFVSFYTLFHPAVPTTPDDWYYITYTRDAIPLLPKNNPTRVLPETLMPLISNISTQILMPIGIGFEMSLAIGASLVLALMITIYAYTFFLVLRRCFTLNEGSSLWITAFFLLFHFLSFRNVNVNNPYLFRSFCLTNYYYYTIPILLNASLVMYCMSSNILNRLTLLSYKKQGLFFCVVYISLLSNLYSNIILVVYFFLVLIQNFAQQKYNLLATIKKNKFLASMLLFFLVILIFEANGGNADNLTKEDNFLSNIRRTCGGYHTLWLKMNFWFKILCLFLFSFSIYLSKKNKNKKQKTIHSTWFFVVSFVLINLFSLLISARSRPIYVTQTDKMFMEFFWLMAGVSFCLAYIVKKVPKIESGVPVLFLILFCHTNTKNKTFEDVQGYDTMPRVNAKLLTILKEANSANVDSLILYVPKTNDYATNWPYPTYCNDILAKTFYSHRLTNKLLKIEIEPVEGLPLIASSLDFQPQLNNSVFLNSDTINITEDKPSLINHNEQ